MFHSKVLLDLLLELCDTVAHFLMKVENASKWPQQDCKLMSESVACGRPFAFLAKPLVGSSRQLDRLAQSWQG